MKFIIIAVLSLLVLVSVTSARMYISDTSEIAGVQPQKGPLYLDDIGKERSDASMCYYYKYFLDHGFYEKLKNDNLIKKKIRVSLWIRNSAGDWMSGDIYNLTIKDEKSNIPAFKINIANYTQSYPIELKYKFKFEDSDNTNISVFSDEFQGPYIYVAFKNEGYKRIPSEKEIRYSVDVCSSEVLLPVGLYVLEKNQKWIRYGVPQTYHSQGVWEGLEWVVKYHKNYEDDKRVEFRPLDMIGKKLIKFNQ